MNPIKLNKRHIVLASIIVSIGVALSINYWIFPSKLSQNKIVESSSENSAKINKNLNIKSEQNTENAGVKSDQDIEKIKLFFKNEKGEREKIKSQIIEVASSDPDYKKKITQEILQENTIESLIKSKSNDDLIDCMKKKKKNGCNVVVSFKTGLTKEHVNNIKNIIKDQTDFKNNEIIITEKNINY